MHTQLLILADVFTQEEISKTRALLSKEDIQWLDDSSCAEHQRMMSVDEGTARSVFSIVDSILGDKFRSVLIPRIQQYFYAESLSFADITDGSANKYKVGQSLAIHNDGRGNTDKHFAGKQIDLAIILYLNDDYEGGEFHLYNEISYIEETRANGKLLSYGEIVNSSTKTASIRPRQGTMIVVGANTLHEVAPVTSGEKLILSWQMQIGR